MAAPAKFLFDMDFAAPDKAREKPATAAEIAQKVAAAEARAYRDGYDAAQREAKAESDRRAALALEEIGIAIKGIASRFAGIETRMETEAVDVAVAVARKLCSELIAAEPLGEITGLVRECFSHLVSTPHLVVRINEFALRRRARADRAAGQAERLRGPPGDPGRARDRRPATAESNGPTAAWCWSARRSKPKSTNSSDAIWRPAVRPKTAMRMRARP